MKKLSLLIAILAILAMTTVFHAANEITLEVLGTYAHGAFNEGAAEISAYDAGSQRLFVVNGATDTIDILSISDPANISLVSQIDISQYGGGSNSVDVYNGIVAVAIEADPKTDNGLIGFFNTDGEFLASVEAGALPDMLTFSPDGTKVLSANEGEPSDDYSIDPLGSITIADLSAGVEAVTAVTLTFENIEMPEGVRIFGPNASAAQDLEPEYIAVSTDGSTAYVTLQENNALAVIDITSATISSVLSLGAKDHSLAGNELDASKDDGMANIANWPIFGLYMPDAIAYYEAAGTGYLVTANEGDTRDYEGYSEEGELGESAVDEAFPNLDSLLTEESILGLEILESIGDTDSDGDLDQLYIPGGRSFSIWAADGTLVYDSGSEIERITAEQYPDDFNSTNDENGDFDGRSDNKGPEPEGVTIAEIDGVTYAFIALERIGGIMVYNISDPMAVSFVSYTNNRDFSGDAEAGTAGDLGPESSIFIPAAESPTGTNLLVVANEVSGTTTIYEIK
jgi:DNA-binding beta-propeller fold protein YncE